MRVIQSPDKVRTHIILDGDEELQTYCDVIKPESDELRLEILKEIAVVCYGIIPSDIVKDKKDEGKIAPEDFAPATPTKKGGRK